MNGKIIVSLGNPLKSDDNIANLVVKKLRISGEVGVVEAFNNPEAYFEKIRKCSLIIFIDAMDFGGRPGEVRMFYMNEIKGVFGSTHSVPVEWFEEKLSSSAVRVIGIQPKSLDYGTSLSVELENTFESIVDRVQVLLDQALL